MLAKIIRYKVIVMSLKPRRGFPVPADDEIFVQERDTFFGYGYSQHRIGKYFDLWFNNPKENDPENFVTFGRITSIVQAYHGKGMIYGTKFGRFYVEEMDDGKEEAKDHTGERKGQGTRGSAGSHRPGAAVIPRVGGERRVQANWVRAGGGRGVLTPRKGFVASEHRSETLREAEHLQGAGTGGKQREGLAASRNFPKEQG
jgi:hypothetical protein